MLRRATGGPHRFRGSWPSQCIRQVPGHEKSPEAQAQRGNSTRIQRSELFGVDTFTYAGHDVDARLGAEAHVSALRRTRVGAFTEARAIGLDLLEELGHKARQSEALLPVETALDDIPALAVTDEDAFRLKQGRSIVLVPRQVETLRAGLAPGARTVSAMCRGVMVALCEMRAGKLEPSRVFHLE